MREKTYYEVLEEMERKNSSQYEILLELGEICFSLIERLNREQARMVRETEVTLNGKKITRSRSRSGAHGIREI